MLCSAASNSDVLAWISGSRLLEGKAVVHILRAPLLNVTLNYSTYFLLLFVLIFLLIFAYRLFACYLLDNYGYFRILLSRTHMTHMTMKQIFKPISFKTQDLYTNQCLKCFTYMMINTIQTLQYNSLVSLYSYEYEHAI